MQSTIVRDSIVGDDWIKQTAAANPIMRKLGADGQPTGDIITGPVRLAFIDTLITPQPTDDGGNKYAADLLFTPMADFTIFYEEYWKWCAMEWAALYNPHNPQNPYPGLHSPFKQQAEKAGRYGGFTPGCVNITTSTRYMPSICDVQGNPIIDIKQRIYAGLWAICAVKPYAYGKAGKTKDGQPMKKGIGFGLQSIMIIGDDTRFGGGPVNAKEMFSNVKVSAPIARPDMSQIPGGPVGAPGMPAPAIPGYTTPGGGVPVPGQQPFQMQQTVYSPQPQQQAPAPQGFIPPGAPAATPSYPSPANSAPGFATSAMTTSPSDLEEMRAMGLA